MVELVKLLPVCCAATIQVRPRTCRTIQDQEEENPLRPSSRERKGFEGTDEIYVLIPTLILCGAPRLSPEGRVGKTTSNPSRSTIQAPLFKLRDGCDIAKNAAIEIDESPYKLYNHREEFSLNIFALIPNTPSKLRHNRKKSPNATCGHSTFAAHKSSYHIKRQAQ